ncbi:hypothetical protein [Streptomyces mesophilus]|uniref:hypothetical protein n=1 Tax=Streptomyces mesophilus TaxID=1775132 RepID=UPI00332A2778
MSEATGRQAPGERAPLYDRVLVLHLSAPDGPLPRGQRRALERQHPRHPKANGPEDRGRAGASVAALLDGHFGRPASRPGELLHVFHDVDVPIHPNEHIRTAVGRADAERVRRTGRWLVRNGTDHCAVAVGLALVAEAGTEDDLVLMRTAGLLSNWFGALAAYGLERLPGGAAALLWLAERVDDWGRVHVVESLCGLDDPVVRSWLLRRACDGEFLKAYVVGSVAAATRLHEVIRAPEVDAEVVDHTGELLQTMTECTGMGMTLRHYPHAEPVLAALLRHLADSRPGARNYCTVAWLVRGLRGELDAEAVGSVERWRPHAEAYAALLDRDDWCEAAREARTAGDPGILWLLEREWGRGLRAFAAR